jgi:hypothetical protein
MLTFGRVNVGPGVKIVKLNYFGAISNTFSRGPAGSCPYTNGGFNLGRYRNQLEGAKHGHKWSGRYK